jgi:hypothetical protein
MTERGVEAALISPARLVVVEAPAGCGKTFQATQYARVASQNVADGRVLMLAHTHAACDTFAAGTRDSHGSVDIRTIDSLIGQIAGAYHKALGLPAEVGSWVLRTKDGYDCLAVKVAELLHASPMVAHSLAQRYPVVICDEHQDASLAQHEVAMALYREGASLRVFGDPMQRIYGGRGAVEADTCRWEALKARADVFETLDLPHRWSGGSEQLGRWILHARSALQAGGRIDLGRSLPPSVSVLFAENRLPNSRRYLPEDADAGQIRALERGKDSLLVLASQNATVDSLRSFFSRLPIWEGHVRERLSDLAKEIQDGVGQPMAIAKALVRFLGGVTKGFTRSAFGNALLSEVAEGCVTKRSGKPALLQELGRVILNEPDHRGVAKVLERVSKLMEINKAFGTVRIDYPREFWDAVRMGQFDDPYEALAGITQRRVQARLFPPPKAISTIHKAKGLECSNVLIVPCDARHFGNSPAARCLLYVAFSRARHSITLVVSRKEPSPLVAP